MHKSSYARITRHMSNWWLTVRNRDRDSTRRREKFSSRIESEQIRVSFRRRRRRPNNGFRIAHASLLIAANNVATAPVPLSAASFRALGDNYIFTFLMKIVLIHFTDGIIRVTYVSKWNEEIRTRVIFYFYCLAQYRCIGLLLNLY